MNLKTLLIRTILVVGTTSLFYPAFSQENTATEWDLNKCINYALEHNIQVNSKKLDVETQKVNLNQSKSDRLPNVSASVSENFNNSKKITNNTYGAWDPNTSTAFSVSSSLTLFEGNSITNGIKKSMLNLDMANLDVEITQNSIILSITQAYLNVLYAKETVDYTNEMVAASEKEVERTRELYKAGSASKLDLVQMESQFSSDKYSLVLAENELNSKTTDLKQLLEIPVVDTFKVSFPEVTLTESLTMLPSKTDAYNTALSTRPEIKSSQLSKNIAELNLKIAKAGYYPSLTMSAGLSANYSSNSIGSFSNQISDGQIQRLGVALNIPIFSKNTNRNSVQLSKISISQAELSQQETEKNLLQTVETVYLNADASVSRYNSATEQLKSATESYNLSEEQFNLGMINVVELLKAKTSYLNAKSEFIQSKYAAILNKKILDFYMGKTITL
ncbi:MAG TPA: TolC family protein [Tenuifilaceae bacterium]|nr:TolC family protein [Tenuifilaceae bacterium]